MGGEKAIVADLRMMTNVVAAPHHHSCADADKGLDDIGLQDETIITDIPCMDMRRRVNEGCEFVAACLPFPMSLASKIVEPAIAQRPQELDRPGWEVLFKALPRHQR